MNCKKCGALLREGAIFCHECGTKVQNNDSMFTKQNRTEYTNQNPTENTPNGFYTNSSKGMKTCKACGSEIAKSAKTCPYCGAKNKPNRLWVVALVAVLLFAVVMDYGSGNSSKKNSNTNKIEPQNSGSNVITNNTNTTPQEQKAIYKVGDTLKDGDVKIVYVSSGDYKEDNQFMQPKEGYKYIFLQLAFINESKSDRSVSFYSFDCYADGYACDMHYGGEEDLSATLSSGRSTSGYILFEVPKDAKEIEIEYTTNILTSKKIEFAFEGDKDSGFVIEPNKTRTEGAYSVGDVIQGNNVIISYLSCEDYKSDNMFIQPKKGYHYVSCFLEFENKGTSDKAVSIYSFDCFADGFACDQLFARDDELSGTISAGRKIKGTVSFEVPDDAEVIELEYNDNIWTSHRIVFTIK